MAGKFLNARGMQDSILSERAANSGRRRRKQFRHPVHAYKCSCSSPACGAGYYVDDRVTVPTPDECKMLMKARELNLCPVGSTRPFIDMDKARQPDGSYLFDRVVPHRRGGSTYWVNETFRFTAKHGRVQTEMVSQTYGLGRDFSQVR